jgi:hypothetical protein
MQEISSSDEKKFFDDEEANISPPRTTKSGGSSIHEARTKLLLRSFFRRSDRGLTSRSSLLQVKTIEF